MSKVYLDWNATALIRPEVLDLVTKIMGEVGNASSVHDFGRRARKYVEDAREQVAKLCAVTLPLAPTAVPLIVSAVPAARHPICSRNREFSGNRSATRYP